MTDQTSPEIDEDDDMPPVSFSLRNCTGDARELTLHQQALGLDMYILIQPDEEGPKVESSHLSFFELMQALAFVLITGTQSDEVTDEHRAEIIDLLTIITDPEEENL